MGRVGVSNLLLTVLILVYVLLIDVFGCNPDLLVFPGSMFRSLNISSFLHRGRSSCVNL